MTLAAWGDAEARPFTPIDPERTGTAKVDARAAPLLKLLRSQKRDGFVPMAVWMPAALVERLTEAAVRDSRSIRKQARQLLRRSMDLEEIIDESAPR